MSVLFSDLSVEEANSQNPAGNRSQREIEALSEMQTADAVVGSVWEPILLENSNSFYFKEKRFRFSEEFRIHSPKVAGQIGSWESFM